MKRVLALMLALSLLIPCMPLSVQADTLSQAATAIALPFDNATFSLDGVATPAPVATYQNPVVSTNNWLYFNNLGLQGDAIAISGLYSVSNENTTLYVHVTYDDNTKERIEFHESDLEHADPTLIPLKLWRGRRIMKLGLTHGATNVHVEIRRVSIRSAVSQVFTLADGTVTVSQFSAGGAGQQNGIVLANYDHRPALTVDKAIEGVRITLAKHVESVEASSGGGYLKVRFYVGDWNESISLDSITRDITTFNIPVPAAMKGQIISKIVMEPAQWTILRKFDFIPVRATATPSSTKVFVNGREIAFDAYNIGGSNYFKLRDVAMALNGTEKQFQVGFDAGANAVGITTGIAYSPIGGELAVTAGRTAKPALPTTSKVLLNGAEASFTVYNIGGSNYFKLRDLGIALDFYVIYNTTLQGIEINTGAGYPR